MRILTLLPALVACGGSPAGDDQAPPTWNGEILALMEEHCVSCHAEGGVGPMPLDTYESLEAASPSSGQPVHSTLLPYLEAGIMPPFGSMTECQPYVGSHSAEIDADELDLVQRWIEADRPRGDGPEVHYEPPPPAIEVLGPPHHLVQRDSAYRPSFGGDGADYACFMIDPGFTETKWVSAITPRIDNERLVHHILLFRAEPNGSEWCHGDEMTSDLIAGWAPGQDGWFLPEGVAFKLEPGDWFAMQIHYDDANDDGGDDRSGMDLYFTDSAEHEAGVLWTGSISSDDAPFFRVPAGERDYQVNGTCTATDALVDPDHDGVEDPIWIFGAWPHMHLLGNHMEASVNRSGAEECLVDVRFSFDDQRGYQFVEPLEVGRNDTIHTTCHFDNSNLNPNNPFDPPRDIFLGEGTTDEMCLNFLMYWPARPVQYCLL